MGAASLGGKVVVEQNGWRHNQGDEVKPENDRVSKQYYPEVDVIPHLGLKVRTCVKVIGEGGGGRGMGSMITRVE